MISMTQTAAFEEMLARRALAAGLSADEYAALITMNPIQRYCLDGASIVYHGIDTSIADALLAKGLADDISDQYSGDIRGIMLSDAGAILALLLRKTEKSARPA